MSLSKLRRTVRNAFDSTAVYKNRAVLSLSQGSEEQTELYDSAVSLAASDPDLVVIHNKAEAVAFGLQISKIPAASYPILYYTGVNRSPLAIFNSLVDGIERGPTYFSNPKIRVLANKYVGYKRAEADLLVVIPNEVASEEGDREFVRELQRVLPESKFSPSITEQIDDQILSQFLGRRRRFASKTFRKDFSLKVNKSEIDSYTTTPVVEGVRLIEIINRQLHNKLLENMKPPALQYRTGRFANSAKVESIVQRARSTEFHYSFMSNPYGTFAPGGKQYTRERNPLPLVARSIREIAKNYITTRFRSRRLK